MKKLSKFDLFMLIICAIMFVDSIASNTASGISSLTWWLIIGVIYMIPSGLIIGELSSAYPQEGGVYVWVKEGLGAKWGVRTTWIFYCCSLFVPASTFIMCAEFIVNMIYPGISLWAEILVALIVLWVCVILSVAPMEESKFVNNISGMIKLFFFVGSFAAGIIYLLQGNPMANAVNGSTLLPTLDDGLMYLPVIVYCCTGMELASASANETDNPKKNLPKIVILCAIVAVVLNILASLGTLIVIPLDELSIVTGTLDVFDTVFHSGLLTCIFTVALILTMISQTSAWQVGTGRGICESAKEGNLPEFFSKETKSGMPITAILTPAVISTVLLVAYGYAAGTSEGLFWSLLGCGVLGSLLPYTFMIVSYQKLRKGKMNEIDHFKCPLGGALSWVVQIVQVCAIILTMYIPGIGFVENIRMILFGTVLMIGSSEIVIHVMNKKQIE